jgi:RNA polymerase sigma-70 factor (ECF subfamily)
LAPRRSVPAYSGRFDDENPSLSQIDRVRRLNARVTSPDEGGHGPVEPASVVGFTAVFEAEFDYVWNSLRRLGVRDGDLEDVTHDVFLAVSGKLRDFDARRPLRPWLFGFAYRRASDYRRLARNRFEVFESAGEASDPSPDPLARAIAREGLGTAQAALEALELGRRAVFILHDLDGVPMPDIALELGIPVNTAYSRLRLARAELAAAVRRLRSGGKL